MSAPRWPASVYADGDEPDPRFSLANERTFLAWIRTSLALLAGAAAMNAFELSMPDLLEQTVAVVLAGAGLATAWQGWAGWSRTERALRRGRPLPAAWLSLPLSLGVGLVAVCLGVAVALAP